MSSTCPCASSQARNVSSIRSRCRAVSPSSAVSSLPRNCWASDSSEYNNTAGRHSCTHTTLRGGNAPSSTRARALRAHRRESATESNGTHGPTANRQRGSACSSAAIRSRVTTPGTSSRGSTPLSSASTSASREGRWAPLSGNSGRTATGVAVFGVVHPTSWASSSTASGGAAGRSRINWSRRRRHVSSASAEHAFASRNPSSATEASSSMNPSIASANCDITVDENPLSRPTFMIRRHATRAPTR